jgi:ATP-dependent helicase/nuclease subunit B
MSGRLSVVSFRSAAEGLTAASQWVAPFIGSAEILVLAATRAAGDEFVRSLPGPGTFGIHRYTVTQFAAVLAGSRAAPATRLATEAIAARVTHEAHKAGKLRYFGPVARFPGFPGALASTLSDLRLAGIGASQLGDGAAAADVAILLAAYERELHVRGLADFPEMLRMATEEARNWPGMPLLLLDVPLPSRAHVEFVQALKSQSESVCVIENGPPERTPDHWSLALEKLRANLFAAQPPRPSEYDDTVDLFSAPGESLEGVEIARRIARLGVPFDRVAILLRQPERYQPMIEEALRRAGIPAYFSRGTARPDPAGRAFLALLACASEGCSASRFAEYLSLGQVPELDANGSPPRRAVRRAAADDELFPTTAADSGPDTGPAEAPLTIATPLAWEKLLVDAAVIGGYERWARRLRGLENEFRIHLAALGAEEQGERERLERELERLANLERFALPLIEDLHALPASANWGVWLESLSQLAARTLANPDPVQKVLSELAPMADVGPVELDEVYGVLAGRLRTLRLEPPHRRYGRVFVGAIDEARGRVFDIVFLPGLAEGIFPRRAAEDPLLLDDARKAISAALHVNKDRVEEERRLLATAAASAGSRFIASYPSMDLAQGRPRVPSFYALEIARAIEGQVPPLRRFENRLAGNSEARLVWPAPEDAARAIDDAEYDLAWLAAHRTEPGGARYLLEANAHLGRTLRTRWKRWDRKWTDADGFVHPDEETRSVLAAQRLSARAYSPSALQNFASCPYRFALSAVLHLREREEAAAIEQLDPLTRGALVHEVQREFLRGWREHPSDNREELLERLDEVLSRVSSDYAERIAPAIARVWHSDLEDIRTDLRGWVVAWLAELAQWEPLHFELGFGLGKPDEDHDPASVPDPVDITGVRVRGSIDLVERHRQTGRLRITDHKTGKPLEREPAAVGGGTVLQPLLYSLAAEKMLGAAAESGRLFYCTQRGSYTEYRIPVDDRARRFFGQAMAVIDEAISAGFLPAAPAEKACTLCEYSMVCGPHEELRVRLKDAEGLVQLNQLRSLP